MQQAHEPDPGSGAAQDVGAPVAAQCRETAIYTYDADRLAAIMQLEPAAVTVYRYDACGEPLLEQDPPGNC